MSTWTVPAMVTHIVDGDTCTLQADLGWNVSLHVDARLYGINAIEHTQPGGPEAAAHLAALIPPGSVVTLVSMGLDKYGGRTDCRLIRADGVDVAQQMIADGYAAAWNGRGPKPVPTWPIPARSARHDVERA